VYIVEAHASDIWQMQSNVSQNVVFANPRNLDERYGLASSCVRNLHLSIPALIDNFDNTTETAYTGWPDRIYLIGTDGRVVFKTAPGPFGFNSKELEAELRKQQQHLTLSR
jgi:type I thyroxine 5'-deiodinase